MGDRTYAWVEIQEEYWPLVAASVEGGYDEVCYDGPTVEFINYRANYGNMEGVTDKLDELQIPYDRGWENGGEYSEGTVYVRFDGTGEKLKVKIYGPNQDKIRIDAVMDWVNKESPDEVIRLLEKEKEKYRPPNNQQLEDCPIREFTPEEAAIIMKYKMENAK